MDLNQFRVRYREQQTLQAADLRDEQAYRLALRRRHDTGPHRWGIVWGLELEADGRDVVVQPGMAVDGYGRTLIVSEPLAVPAEAIDTIQAPSIAVALRYSRLPEPPTGRGQWPCGPGQHTRWNEETRVCLFPIPVVGEFDPAVLLEDVRTQIPSAGNEVELDDPKAHWSVFLGHLERLGSGAPFQYQADLRNRPYAALSGETVRAPSGQVQMSIGRVLGSGGAQFAVSLADVQGGFTDDRLTVDSPGATTLRGRTTLVSDFDPGERSKESNSAVEDRRSDLLLSDYCFTAEDLIDPDGIWCRLNRGREFRRSGLPLRFQSKALRLLTSTNQLTVADVEARNQEIVAMLNRLAQDPDLFDPKKDRATLRPETWQMLTEVAAVETTRTRLLAAQSAYQRGADARQRAAMTVLNRMILEDLFAGQLRVRNDRPYGAWGMEFRPSAEPPKAAAPWRVYRADRTEEDDTVTKQLRIEIADPGTKGNPKRSRLAVGYFEKQVGNVATACNFRSCLTVDAACTVTVRGALFVEGDVVEGPIQADVNDPRLAQNIVAGATIGASAGLAATTLKVDVQIPQAPVAGQEWSYTVSVTNTGQQGLSTIGVYDAIGYSGLAGLPTTRVVGLIRGLATGKDTQFTVRTPGRSSSKAGDTIDVVVTLVGITEALQYMYAEGRASAQIISPPAPN